MQYLLALMSVVAKRLAQRASRSRGLDMVQHRLARTVGSGVPWLVDCKFSRGVGDSGLPIIVIEGKIIREVRRSSSGLTHKNENIISRGKVIYVPNKSGNNFFVFHLLSLHHGGLHLILQLTD